MDIFKNYAAFYNLLYEDKDYNNEANYIISLIKKFSESATSILNLGCGTGKHDFILSEKGYNVTGVDMSADMVEIAKNGAAQKNLQREIQFLEGDIRDLSINKQFDVVLALFHVISYQTSNDDLLKALETAYTHLKPGGLFIFDCWYGPGVLSDPPVVRVKNFENENLEIKRIAQPFSHPNENIIDVNYNIILKDKKLDRYSEIKETHRMRYLFKPELEIFFNKFNLKCLQFKEWMTDNEPSLDSWTVYFVLRK